MFTFYKMIHFRSPSPVPNCVQFLALIGLFSISCASSQPKQMTWDDMNQYQANPSTPEATQQSSQQNTPTQEQSSAVGRFFKGFAEGYNNSRNKNPVINCYTAPGSPFTTCR